MWWKRQGGKRASVMTISCYIPYNNCLTDTVFFSCVFSCGSPIDLCSFYAQHDCFYFFYFIHCLCNFHYLKLELINNLLSEVLNNQFCSRSVGLRIFLCGFIFVVQKQKLLQYFSSLWITKRVLRNVFIPQQLRFIFQCQ